MSSFPHCGRSLNSMDTTYQDINNTIDRINNILAKFGGIGHIDRIVHPYGDSFEVMLKALQEQIGTLVLANRFTLEGLKELNEAIKDLKDGLPNDIEQIVVTHIDEIARKVADLLFDPHLRTQVAGIPTLNNIINEGGELTWNDMQNIPFLVDAQSVKLGNTQGIEYDGARGDWYIMQSDDKAEPNEGFIVIKSNSSGTMVSNMYVPGGGHGQTTFMRADATVNWIYFVRNAKIYRVGYEDFTTKGEDQWELIMPISQTPLGVHGFDYTASRASNNAFVWRHIHETGERDASVQADDAKRHYIIYGQNATFNSDGAWTLKGDIATLDINQYVDFSQNENSMQGMAVLNKRDVTGMDDGSNVFYVFISYGVGKSNIMILEYNQDETTMTYVTTMYGLDKVIRKPQERHKFEIEGLTHVRYKIGSDYGAGIIFMNSGGRAGSSINRGYGFVNNQLLNLMDAFGTENTRDTQRGYSDSTKLDYLWQIGVGEFTLREDEWATLQDLPVRWKGNVFPTYSYVTTSLPDLRGSFTQRLTIPGYTVPTEIYERTVIFNASRWGADWRPEAVTPWAPQGQYGARAKGKTQSQNAMWQLTEQVTTYLPANTGSFDYEGLPSDQAYSIINVPLGALMYPEETTFLQTATVHNTHNNNVVTYQRYVRGVVGQYGASLETKTYTSAWNKQMTHPVFSNLVGAPGWVDSSVRETNDLIILELSGTLASNVDFTSDVPIGKLPASVGLPGGLMGSFGTLNNITPASTASGQNITASITVDTDGTVSVNGNGVWDSGSNVRGSVVIVKQQAGMDPK